METYRTEEEQVEALKRWWQENGKSTVFAIVLALGGVFGWRAWNDHQFDRAAEASAMFEQLLQADAAVQSSGEPTVTAETLAETVKSAYGNLSYGQFAALYKAKYAVMKADYVAAAEELQWVLDQRPEAAVAAQAQMRLAQVYFAQGEFDRASALINSLAGTGFEPEAQELKGDILLEQGDAEGALAAYRGAKSLLKAQQVPGQNPMLDMKINDLASNEEVSES